MHPFFVIQYIILILHWYHAYSFCFPFPSIPEIMDACMQKFGEVKSLAYKLKSLPCYWWIFTMRVLNQLWINQLWICFTSKGTGLYIPYWRDLLQLGLIYRSPQSYTSVTSLFYSSCSHACKTMGIWQKMEMKWKLETDLETEIEMQTLTCWSPSKMHVLLAFIPRHLRALSTSSFSLLALLV